PERDLRDAIAAATRRYAKRQETWFRHQLRTGTAPRGAPEVWMVDAVDAPEQLAREIAARWQAASARSPAPAPSC
ncbi:MAG TPA: hypothetical protein VH158_09095, partial [Gemmatimonadales bacterium]|nr:hypothetical protein [Gemmatimonadales bacterium]